MQEVIRRIHDLTQIDLQHKSIGELLACPIEELGELARELKIELGTFGNHYKKPDEGSKAEAVDLFIGAICMAFAPRSKTDIVYPEQGNGLCCPIYVNTHVTGIFNKMQKKQAEKPKNIWVLLANASKYLGKITDDSFQDAIQLSPHNSCYLAACAKLIFHIQGGNDDDFIEKANEKLDKWVKTQTDSATRTT